MAGDLSSEEYQRCLEILELEEGANLEEIKIAYRTKAKSCHPDKNPNDPHATEKFQDLHWAMKTLMENIGYQNDIYDDDIIHYVEVDELLYFILKEYVMERMFRNRQAERRSRRRDGYRKNSSSDNRFSKYSSKHADNENALVKTSSSIISVPDEKYAIIEINDCLQEDMDLLNVLRKKYQNEGTEDEDIDEEVKKFTSFHEWEKAEKEKIKKKRKNKIEIVQQKPKYQSKKDQEHQNYRRQKEGEKIQEELLLKLKEEEEKEQKRQQKEAEKRRQIEKQKYDSLVEHASYLVKETKPKDDGKKTRKIGSASLKQEFRRQPQTSKHGIQEATAEILCAKSESHSDSLDDIWDENWNSVNSSAPISTASELWDDDIEKKNKDIRYQEKSHYIKKLQEKEHGRNLREREELRAAENKKSKKGRNQQNFSNKDSSSSNSYNSQSFKDNNRFKQKKPGNQTFTRNVSSSSSSYFHADSEDRSLQDAFGDKPWIKEAPPPDINIWEQRQSQIETLKDLQPYSTEDEETMLQRAIELSKQQVIEDEKRRRKLQAAYELQLQYLSKNTELLENSDLLPEEPENSKKSEKLNSGCDWPLLLGQKNTEIFSTKLDVNQETSDEMNAKSNVPYHHGGARPKVKHVVNSSKDHDVVEENFFDHDKSNPKLSKATNETVECEKDYFATNPSKDEKQSEYWDDYLIHEPSSSHDSISRYSEKREKQHYSNDFELKSKIGTEGIVYSSKNYTDAEYTGSGDQEDYWDDDLIDVHLSENLDNNDVSENPEYDFSERELNVQMKDECGNSELSYDRDLSITSSNSAGNKTLVPSSEVNFKELKMDENVHDFNSVSDENKKMPSETQIAEIDEDNHAFSSVSDENKKIPSETHIPVAENLTKDYAFLSGPCETTPVEENAALNGETDLSHYVTDLPPKCDNYLNQASSTIKEEATCDYATTSNITENTPQNRQPIITESSLFTGANDVNLSSPSASSLSQETMKLKEQVPNAEFGLGTGFPFLHNPAVAGISPFGPIDPSFLLPGGMPMNSPMNPQLLWLMYSNPFFIQQLQALQMYYAALGAASAGNFTGQNGEVPKFNTMGQTLTTELTQLTADTAQLSTKTANVGFAPTSQPFIGSENLFTSQSNMMPSFASSQTYPPFGMEEMKQKLYTEPPGIDVNLFRPHCTENSQMENDIWKESEKNMCNSVPNSINANSIGIQPPNPPNFQHQEIDKKSEMPNPVTKPNSNFEEREYVSIANMPCQVKSLQSANYNDSDYNGLGCKKNITNEQHSDKAMWTNLKNTENAELPIESQRQTVYNHNNDYNSQLSQNITSVNSKNNEYSDHGMFGDINRNKENISCQQINQSVGQGEDFSQNAYSDILEKPEKNEEEPIPWGNSEDELADVSVKESYDKWSDTDDESEMVLKKPHSVASGSDVWDDCVDDASGKDINYSNKHHSPTSSISDHNNTTGGGDYLTKNRYQSQNHHGKNKSWNSPQSFGDYQKSSNGSMKSSPNAHRMNNNNYQNKNQRWYHSEKGSPSEDVNSKSHNPYLRSRGGPRAEKLRGCKPKISGSSSTSPFKQRERSQQNSSY